MRLMNLNNPQSQGYWFVLREDQSNVLISSNVNSFTLHNPQIAGQEARYIVDTGERQFIQIEDAPAAARAAHGLATEPAAADGDDNKEQNNFWDRNRIKLLLTLCLQNNFKHPIRDKTLLEQIAEHVGTTPDECCAKYKNLRRTFIRLLKKKRYGKEIKWVHYSICEKVFNDCKSLPLSVLEPWDEPRVRSLLEAYLLNLGRFRSSDCLQKEVWRGIASELGTTEYNCYHKFKNLKKAHFKWLQRSRDSGKPSKWPYHQYFDRIFDEYNPIAGPWDRNKTKQLINAYIQIADKFRSSRYQKKHLWKEISLVVGESSGNCDKKFRNMKQTYMKLKNKADAGGSIAKWRYYKDFENIYNPFQRWECGTPRTHDEDYVKQILNFYLENKDKFRDQRIKKKTLWRRLAPKIGMSPEECDRKFRNLKQTYVRLSEGRTILDRTRWPYYEHFEKIFDAPQHPRRYGAARAGPTASSTEAGPTVPAPAPYPRQAREHALIDIERLFDAMDEANHIQRERNTILEKLLQRK